MDLDMLRDQVRKFLNEKLAPVVEAADLEMQFPLVVYQELAKAGFGGIFLPEEYGGGGSLEGLLIVMEEMSRLSPGFALSAMSSFQLFGYNVARMGTPAQKEKYLTGLIREAKIGCWGLTEPDIGSDAVHIKTTATKDGKDYILKGAKTFITNAPLADYFIIIANSGGEGFESGTAFLLDKGMEGLSVSKPFKKYGHRCSPTGQVFLDNVRVGSEQRLGEEGRAFYDMKHSLDLERFLIGPMVSGMLETLLDKCVAYAYTRQQFGQPILNFQLIQEKIARMGLALEILRALTEKGIGMIKRGENINRLATSLKLYGAKAATELGLEAMQIHGGNGYMHEYGVEMFMRDAKLLEIGGGTNEMMLQILAKHAIKSVAKKHGMM
jgi:alkylation response protein AidB-like acyl-CoA dehydrogenase